MRITLGYNLRQEQDEAQAELLSQEDVDRLLGALRQLGHEVTPVEVSGPSDRMIDRLLNSRPDLVFNVAEGTDGPMREAIFPAIYRTLGLAFTGGGPRYCATRPQGGRVDRQPLRGRRSEGHDPRL